MDTIKKIFKERLEGLIEKHGGVERMAVQIDVSFYTLQDWRRKDTLPSADSLVKIADEYGVSIDWLLGRTDKPK